MSGQNLGKNTHIFPNFWDETDLKMWNHQIFCSKCQFLPRLLGYVLPGQQLTNERSHAPWQHRYDTNRHDLVGNKEISLEAGPTCSGWFDVDCWAYAEACWYGYSHGKKQFDLKGWGIYMTAWRSKMASREIHFGEGVNLSRWMVQWWVSTFYVLSNHPGTKEPLGIQLIQPGPWGWFWGWSNFDPYPQGESCQSHLFWQEIAEKNS